MPFIIKRNRTLTSIGYLKQKLLFVFGCYLNTSFILRKLFALVYSVFQQITDGNRKLHLVDFKSNRATPEKVPELCDRYRGQLELYRAALAKLLGITPNLIECRLLFTGLGALETIS